jgi:DNA-binding Xre family transcriptional regulator
MKNVIGMEHTMAKKSENRLGPAFDKWRSDPGFKKDFDKEYQEFALSELILALMEDDKKSVRKLAEIVGLSPTAIQDLRSGKAKDVKFKNFLNIVEACGFGLELVKGDKRIRLHSGAAKENSTA